MGSTQSTWGFFPWLAVMKFNVADPQTGSQKIFEIDDDKRLRFVLDKRIAQEVNGAIIGDQFQDYTFKITGGIDKQGFPMRQGILVPDRVRLLLRESKGYILQKDGDRKRRSVRGCMSPVKSLLSTWLSSDVARNLFPMSPTRFCLVVLVPREPTTSASFSTWKRAMMFVNTLFAVRFLPRRRVACPRARLLRSNA